MIEAPSVQPAGLFVAVVGPSGAGKDTLINHARQVFSGDPRVIFVRRIVTRSSDPRTEDHDSVSRDAFERALAGGEFSLSWDAHGLRYALPGAVDAAVGEGRLAVANVSRGVLREAARRFGRVLVVNVDAPEEVRRARIAARGREHGADMAERSSRTVQLPAELPTVTILNDGPPEIAGGRLVDLLGSQAAIAG